MTLGNINKAYQQAWSGYMAPVTIPIRTKNPLNGRRNWRPVAREAKRARTTTYYLLKGRIPTTKPAVIKLTRLSPGEMDDDNLAATLKNVRDGVADVFGSDDSRRSGLKFLYEQEKSKTHGVRVEVLPPAL